MKASQVIHLARVYLDDEEEPHLWSDAYLLAALDEAQDEAARRARLFIDSTHATVSRITLAAGTSVYTLDSRVIRVERARLSSEDRPMRVVMLRDLDWQLPGWETSEESPPSFIVPDWQAGKVRFVGIPQAVGTVNLTVLRLPIDPIVNLDQSLEVADHHCRSLAHWVCHLAYLKRDTEAFDPKRGDNHVVLFEREFGVPQPAYDEAWVQRHYTEDRFYGQY